MGNDTSAIRKAHAKTPSVFNTKTKKFQNMTGGELLTLAKTLASRSNDYYYKQGLNATNATQRLVTELGMNGKPTILSKDEFDRVAAESGALLLYRGVTGNGTMSAEDIKQHTMRADLTYIGDGIHGDGLYFSTDRRTAQSYAGWGGAVTTAFIDKSKMRAIDENKLDKMMHSDPEYSHTVFRDKSEYAIYKGYNVIIAYGGNGSIPHGKPNGEDFYVPIDRAVLVVRDD